MLKVLDHTVPPFDSLCSTQRVPIGAHGLRPESKRGECPERSRRAEGSMLECPAIRRAALAHGKPARRMILSEQSESKDQKNIKLYSNKKRT